MTMTMIADRAAQIVHQNIEHHEGQTFFGQNVPIKIPEKKSVTCWFAILLAVMVDALLRVLYRTYIDLLFVETFSQCFV